MSWPRLGAVATGLLSFLVTATPAHAAAVSAQPAYVQTGAGTVTVTRTVDAASETASYAVNFTGQIGVHGWTYNGTLAGASSNSGFFALTSADVPAFSVTATPAGVTGECAGQSNTGSTVSPDLTPDYTFSCLLSKDGATPWLVQLDSVLTPNSAGAGATWTGAYVALDAETATVGSNRGLTFGDAQFQTATVGGGLQYSLQLSGQLAFGSAIYRGELQSELSAIVYLHDGVDMPPTDVSGRNGTHQVTGWCSGRPGGYAYDVFGGWTFFCTLSLDSAAPVNVTIKTAPTMQGQLCDAGATTCDTVDVGPYKGN